MNLESMMSSISWQQLELEAGSLVSSLCRVRLAFKQCSLTMYEYAALKVVVMTSADDLQEDVVSIRDKYLHALASHLTHSRGQHATHSRMSSLLSCVSHVSNAASLLLQSKMFYVPFLMQSNLLP